MTAQTAADVVIGAGVLQKSRNELCVTLVVVDIYRLLTCAGPDARDIRSPGRTIEAAPHAQEMTNGSIRKNARDPVIIASHSPSHQF